MVDNSNRIPSVFDTDRDFAYKSPGYDIGPKVLIICTADDDFSTQKPEGLTAGESSIGCPIGGHLFERFIRYIRVLTRL